MSDWGDEAFGLNNKTAVEITMPRRTEHREAFRATSPDRSAVEAPREMVAHEGFPQCHGRSTAPFTGLVNHAHRLEGCELQDLSRSIVGEQPHVAFHTGSWKLRADCLHPR